MNGQTSGCLLHPKVLLQGENSQYYIKELDLYPWAGCGTKIQLKALKRPIRNKKLFGNKG